jgi:pyruvate-formate lyase-activating enzyme
MAEIIEFPRPPQSAELTPEAVREFARRIRSDARATMHAGIQAAREQALQATAEQVWYTLALFDIMQVALKVMQEDREAAIQLLASAASATDTEVLKNLLFAVDENAA